MYKYKFCIRISSVTPTGVSNEHKSVISISLVQHTRNLNKYKIYIRISPVTPTGVPNEHKPVISISTYISP